jgi:transposase
MGEENGRRKFGREFKAEAVRLVTEGGRPVSEAARGLGIHANLLYRWKRQYEADPEGSFPGKGRLSSGDEEVRRLRRENADLRLWPRGSVGSRRPPTPGTVCLWPRIF